mgnify:CR=1 FL=1
MARFTAFVIVGLLINTNLYAEDETISIELIEFLADWEQEDDVWLDTEISTPAVTIEKEADDESEK